MQWPGIAHLLLLCVWSLWYVYDLYGMCMISMVCVWSLWYVYDLYGVCVSSLWDVCVWSLWCVCVWTFAFLNWVIYLSCSYSLANEQILLKSALLNRRLATLAQGYTSHFIIPRSRVWVHLPLLEGENSTHFILPFSPSEWQRRWVDSNPRSWDDEVRVVPLCHCC